MVRVAEGHRLAAGQPLIGGIGRIPDEISKTHGNGWNSKDRHDDNNGDTVGARAKQLGHACRQRLVLEGNAAIGDRFRAERLFNWYVRASAAAL